ncbi:MAG: hypothetical protein AXW12_00600 [Thalassospira sp. Nap_22]|nr:MAG: hypothetical protein AXW12_00600 [Thalassospira sp. Nap_22]
MSNKPYSVVVELTEDEARYIDSNMVRKGHDGCASISDVCLSCVREMIRDDKEAHDIEAAARQVGA